MQKTQSLYRCGDVFTAPLHGIDRGSDKIENTVLLLSRACMLRALPCNGRCLPSHCLAAGLYATFVNRSADMQFMSVYLVAVTKHFMSAIKQANFDKQFMSCFKVHSQVVFVTRNLEFQVKIDVCHILFHPFVILFTVKLISA
jgi:hypothetical protein